MKNDFFHCKQLLSKSTESSVIVQDIIITLFLTVFIS